MKRRDFLGTAALTAVSATLSNSETNAQTTDLPEKTKPHVYLVHYDNSYTNPLFYIFSTFEGAENKVREIIDDQKDEYGNSAWEQVEIAVTPDVWQWTDEQEYLSIRKETVLM